MSARNSPSRVARGRGAGSRAPVSRAETAPTTGVLVAGSARSLALAACFGSILVLLLDLLAMLVASLVLPGGAGPAADAGGIGLGILAAASIGASAGAALWGVLLVPSSFALARMYRSRARDGVDLRDTIEVRGRVPDAPLAPLVVVASCVLAAAIIPAIACGALVPEYARRAEDAGGVAAANGMLAAFVASLALVVLSAAAIIAAVLLGRRVRVRLAHELPAGALGEAGTPTTRVRAESARERAARRRGSTGLDRIRVVTTAMLGAGVGSVILGVMMRKPSRYGPEEHYAPIGEAILAGLVVGGAALVVGGVVAAIAFAAADVRRTRAALRAVRDDPDAVTGRERIRAREATTALGGASMWLLSWWFAPAVVAAGALFARDVLPVMNGIAPGATTVDLVDALAASLLWLGPLWVAGIVAIAGARLALDASGHLLRNAFGYKRPIEEIDDGPELDLHV